MRRITSASAYRLSGRVGACSLVLGVLVATVFSHGPGIAVAEPGGPEGISALVAQVADANQKLQDLGSEIQAEQESVNQALVGVQSARDAADKARGEVEASKSALTEADAAIASAQQRFDQFAASAYVNGPSASYLTADDPREIIDTAATGQTLAVSSRQAIDDLMRARTEQVNRDSAARMAQQKADQALADAQSSQDAAVKSLTDAQQTFKDQQRELDRLSAERASAQAKLAEVRKVSASAPAGTASSAAAPAGNAVTPSGPSADWDRSPGAPAPAGGNWATPWDPTLPAIPSAFVSGDPVAIINAILGIATTSMQATQQMGRSFLQKLGILPTPTGITNGAIPRVYGQQATEYVIKRGMAVMGTPYSWGGGNAAGASRGIDSGSGTVGFDCSGLMLYMFAGVGIKLDHYSGSQYNAGRKVPTSEMRRGDMLFWGPNASQHVAMYLGGGQMLEAPYTGSVVKVSPVRTSGMTPYATRLIEW
jgi:cell wall-associated NlpC family hydrolase